MKFIYTEHAKEKLKRSDIRTFGINQNQLEKAIVSPDYPVGKTPTGEDASIINLQRGYILRVVYVKLGSQIKIITFYISKRGRYGT